MTEVARHSSGALRQRVVASAAVFARRHFYRRGLAALPPLPLALACLFLAAKVEESHFSARYLLKAAERAAESRFSLREGRRGGGSEKGGAKTEGNNNGSIALVASSSLAPASLWNRNSHPVSAPAATAAGPSPLKKQATAAAPSSSSISSSCPLPQPTTRQLLEAEVELVSSLGAQGLLVWSPYPDALEAAAAIERESERELRGTGSRESSGRKKRKKKEKQAAGAAATSPDAPPLRLGARAWAAVSLSFARTDACLWAPPHVVGFAAAAVAAAAADDAERIAEEEEGDEEEEEIQEAEEEREAEGEEREERASSSFAAAATRWFSSVDVDLDQVAEVAAELCHAAGVERAAAGAAGTDGTRDKSDSSDNSGAWRRADAVARAFEFLRSGGVSAAAAAAL
jgi:hypothetical protein